MSDQLKLKADPEHLTGLLLIKSAEQGNENHYYLLAALDAKRLLSSLRNISSDLEMIIGGTEELIKRIQADIDIQTGKEMRFFVYGVGGFAKSSIDSHVLPHEDIDVYDAGIVSSFAKLKDLADSVILRYFKIYDSQRKTKREADTSEVSATILDTPPERLEQTLYRLSVRLMNAADKNDPIAQLEAEDSLRAFTFGHTFKYAVNQIITHATAAHKNREDLIGLQCRIIVAIAKEDFNQAKDLHGLYERIRQ